MLYCDRWRGELRHPHPHLTSPHLQSTSLHLACYFFTHQADHSGLGSLLLGSRVPRENKQKIPSPRPRGPGGELVNSLMHLDPISARSTDLVLFLPASCIMHLHVYGKRMRDEGSSLPGCWLMGDVMVVLGKIGTYLRLVYRYVEFSAVAGLGSNIYCSLCSFLLLLE